jgi:soluble lytic murein transglycosylase-like protein
MRTPFWVLAIVSLPLAGCVTATSPAPQAQSTETQNPSPTALDGRISYYAHLYAVPESLVRRLIQRESGYNVAAHHGPYWGLTQLRVETARGVGYRGSARGLLSADANLKYGIAYLSNAYLVAGGDPDRALALYASGFYYEARRKGLLNQLRTAEGG